MIMIYCRKCGSELRENWKFCPSCGSENMFSYSDMFSDLDVYLDSIQKKLFSNLNARSFESDFEFLNLKNDFKTQKKGFTMSLNMENGKPVVTIKTFGDVKPEEINKELGKMGIKSGRISGKSVSDKKSEEPKTQINRLPNKVVVKLELPGVLAKDITIELFSESIEVKALAEDKIFYKIIQIDRGWKLISKEFKNKTLELVFEP
jgi:HSP20 family molecular chaperone IbpA/RNA polymerase subunit RPABC4/transcription elongation factor Spt4